MTKRMIMRNLALKLGKPAGRQPILYRQIK
ncbi:delta-aminolevulinic acid dehydratase [Sulfitobacter indolifex HEL-45]|uniref:Delta-aminolevulinic acid dehydratase n=1 Tax=Sulfitobacter indolifex HEL-45 TaxID=391624 RepID=A0ABM9X541_9RHOB|nr:delta-aminolevulinic acid dehydratase [Sulfitobacter indolifex HEL-45]